MHESSLGRSSIAQAALVSLLTFFAISLLSVILAYWVWAWFAPRAEPQVEASAVQSGSVASAAGIFGIVPHNQASATPTGIAIKLLGVVAASGGRRGYAVLQLEAKQILAVHEGEDIAPGIRLAEVHEGHVILERSGLRESLALPEKKLSIASVPQAAASHAEQMEQSTVLPQVAQPTAGRARRSARRQGGSDE